MTKNWRYCAGSINFGSGIHSTRNVTAWFAATLISGRQIQVAGGTRGNDPLRLSCPTDECNSIPMDWVLPTSEILAKVEKLAEEERKASALKPAAVTIGNGKTVYADKSHEHFVSRLCRLAFHLKRHSKAVPPIPAGLEPPSGVAG